MQLMTASEDDIEAILVLERNSFAMPWSRLSFLEELSCKTAFNHVARSENGRSVIGYHFFRIIADEMHILKIATAPEWRCCGAASQILEKSFQQALEAGAVSAFLEVRPSNTPALALYKKLGFQIIGKRPGYYPETGEDALVLMKNLKEVT